MLWSRLSLPASKCWLTTNPDNRRHWLKREVIDRIHAYRGTVIKCGLDDNPSLTDEYKRDLRSRLIGHWRKRLAEGEWVDPVGLIYPSWSFALASDFQFQRYSLALDWASSGVYAALLIGHHAKGRHVLAERRHDAQVDGVLTDFEQFRATQIWAASHVMKCPDVWVGDPSTSAGFQRCITDASYTWIDADNEVLPGIQKTAHDLASGVLTIQPDSANVPDSVLENLQDVDLASTPIDVLAMEAVRELLITGRVGIGLDVADGRPFWRLYRAKDILSWYGDDGGVKRVVLRESWMRPEPAGHLRDRGDGPAPGHEHRGRRPGRPAVHRDRARRRRARGRGSRRRAQAPPRPTPATLASKSWKPARFPPCCRSDALIPTTRSVNPRFGAACTMRRTYGAFSSLVSSAMMQFVSKVTFMPWAESSTPGSFGGDRRGADRRCGRLPPVRAPGYRLLAEMRAARLGLLVLIAVTTAPQVVAAQTEVTRI